MQLIYTLQSNTINLFVIDFLFRTKRSMSDYQEYPDVVQEVRGALVGSGLLQTGFPRSGKSQEIF